MTKNTARDATLSSAESCRHSDFVVQGLAAGWLEAAAQSASSRPAGRKYRCAEADMENFPSSPKLHPAD